jgi:hypothetical protein
MIYLAAKHYKTYSPISEYPATWTAISRTPYLTTLATAKAHGTWDGGGYFEDNNIIYINQSRYVSDKNNVPSIAVERINVVQGVEFRPIAPNGQFYYEEDLYSLLLERRGWQPVLSDGKSKVGPDENSLLWWKNNSKHAYTLSMTLLSEYGQGNTCRFNLKHKLDHREFNIDSYEWADWDQQGRLVYTSQGKLFAGQLGENGVTPVQLGDFNLNKVRLIESPPWAKTWDQPFDDYEVH